MPTVAMKTARRALITVMTQSSRDMGGLFAVVLIGLGFWGFFSALAKGEKPSRKDSDIVSSVMVFFFAPLFSTLIILLFFGPAPVELNPLLMGVLWMLVWYGLYKLIFFLIP